MLLTVSNVSKSQNGNLILDNVSLIQARNQNIGIIGETGSGKTTLLKIIGGLLQSSTGSVTFKGEKVIGPEDKLMPGHPKIGYLSQYFELPNNYRVEEVLDYANRLSLSEAENIYNLCKIEKFLHRKTSELSGGEKQRIALARILIASPILLLLDEPFSNLDNIHKGILKKVLKDVCTALQISSILISHDPQDTLSWAEQILVLQNGKVVQQGSPYNVYHLPESDYVAALLGNYNKLSPLLLRSLCFQNQNTAEDSAYLRPERFQLSKRPGSGIMGEVTSTSFYGSFYEQEVAVLNERVLVHSIQNFQPNETVYVSLTNLHEGLLDE